MPTATDLPFVSPLAARRIREGDLVIPEHQRGIHETQLVAFGQQIAWIDTALAEFVYLAWQLGIQTVESCEDLDDGDALVVFEDADDYRLFVTHVAPSTGDSSLRRRIDTPVSGSNYRPRWEAHLYLPSTSSNIGFGRRETLRASLSFPRADIPDIVTALRQAPT